MATPATVMIEIATADEMRGLGAQLATALVAGDVVLLSGELGAGKTTLAQGIGIALGVRGQVTSPTFVLARMHPSLADGPPLVHVDAYRLQGWDDLEALDLEATLDEAITLVEWGEGVIEGLAPDRLEVRIHRARGDDVALDDAAEDVRTVEIRPIGERWRGVAVLS